MLKMSCKCDTINIVNDNNIIVVSHADGRDGKSAYQQAVEGGYTGTEKEFNCSLSLLADVAEGKRQIADAINTKGGSASADSSFSQLADDIVNLPLECINPSGYTYIEDYYIPKSIGEVYSNRIFLKNIYDTETLILRDYAFADTTYLQSAEFVCLKQMIGTDIFKNSAITQIKADNLEFLGGRNVISASKLVEVNFLSLKRITGAYTLSNNTSLQIIKTPNVSVLGQYSFHGLTELVKIFLGKIEDGGNVPFSGNYPKMRLVAVGANTDINLYFQNWTATYVIAEGQSGIDELNNNLRTNLLEKLYDHSTDGQTRTLRLGWLAHVTQENIDYANSKGWTLTT